MRPETESQGAYGASRRTQTCSRQEHRHPGRAKKEMESGVEPLGGRKIKKPVQEGNRIEDLHLWIGRERASAERVRVPQRHQSAGLREKAIYQSLECVKMVKNISEEEHLAATDHLP